MYSETEYNIYYSPEAFGLEPVAEIDYSSGGYEFDTRIVWKDKQGSFYTARDSGCSCPTPFENYHGLPDLEQLDFRALEEEIRAQTSYYRTVGEMVDFLAKVKAAVGA